MSLSLPFDGDVISELIGSVLVLSQNSAHSTLFLPFNEIILSSGGQAKGIGGWGIEDGVLRLYDEKGGLLYEFRAIETKNNCVYAVGRNVLLSSLEGVSRVILHKKSLLSSTDVGICVSSHVEYEKSTLPRLFKSLKREGFNMNNVFVVVGGDNKATGESSIDSEYKVRITRQKQNFMGFTAFSELSDFGSLHYWLLLHDTCDVVDGFYSKLKSLDIGLSPDMILFQHPKEKLEIGVYSAKFIKSRGIPNQSVKPTEYLGILVNRANLVVALDSVIKKEVERDIYGTGIKREPLLFNSLGIRKFKGKVTSGGKP